ncbi:MAG: hypothetical protein Q7U54_05185 [Bacteroidales bacterium]|nr:hypothetical protein [Bacteroidales bacterium]
MQTRAKIFFLLVFVSAVTSDFAYSQKTPIKKDTTLIYQNIETFSKKRQVTKYMYSIFFEPVSKHKKKIYKKLIRKPYSAFEGKIIRKIHIETLDPFGFSIADTVEKEQGHFAKNANKLHIKSQRITIRNLLLIRQNQVFDSLLVKESERLVRSRNYVNDVSFFVMATAPKSDSVDIFIRELDKWSLIPDGAFSASSITINLKDNNFLGLGHESKNEYTWNDAAGNYAYSVNYYIPNIRNTYISSTLHLESKENGNFTRSVGLDRPFFSPYAKWAAGVNFSQQFRLDYIHASDSLLILQPFKFNIQDYWAGYSMQVFKGRTENFRATNFISALRFYRVRYLEKPDGAYDAQHYFSNENFYLASFGISTRKYVQDKYIFKFGVTEDVPVGKVFSFTAGYQNKNNSFRKYLGAKVSSGNYYPWGYLSFNFEYGTFMRESNFEQGVFTAGLNYFTGLIEIGKWKFRQFVKPQLTIGINRFAYDSLTLNDGSGIDGFNSSSLSGTRRMILTLQTQSYAPWNFIGFRFGPYLAFSLGMLGEAENGFRNSKVYSQIGLGVLVKNEHLIINTFQLSIAYFPSIPGNGQNVFKGNSFRTVDFGFRDFEIGKPAVVVFQ